MKLIKMFFQAMGIIILVPLLVFSIGYILYKVPLVVGIIFTIVLGLLMGYFAVKIKLIFEKRSRENDIPGKVDNQEFKIKMIDTKKAIKETPKEPEIKKPRGRPKKVVDKPKTVKKVKKVKK